jgi:hypothetical protein
MIEEARGPETSRRVGSAVSDYPKPEVLSDEHYESVLAPRGISLEVAEERGYASINVTHKRWLKAHGFGGDSIANVMAHGGILIPTPSPNGITTYQLRPDRPRDMKGGPRKYESQRDHPNMLDVHPRSLEHLDNREVPITFAEGPMKADALLSAGLQCVVSVRGIYGWRTKGWDDATIALPEFEEISWKERDTALVWDSDVTENMNVANAAIRLASLLMRRGANASILYPPALPGSKFGVDDYLATGGSLAGLLVLSLDALDGDGEPEEKELSPEMLREIAGDPVRMMDKLVAFYSKHLAAPRWVYDLMALWCVHTHAVEAFDTTGYMSFESEEPNSGKSRAIELLAMTCHAPEPVFDPSDATIYRIIEMLKPTLMLDEVDNMLDATSDRKALLGMLNVGYRRNGPKVPRMGGPNRDELLRFSTFCPKAMAGLETLANKPALYSRCFHIPMRRRTDDEAGGNFIYDDVLPDGKRLAERASAWAKLNVDELRDKRPQSPAAWLTNRNWEVSRPLWIIAEQLGDDWKERLLDALEEEAKGSGETQTWGVRLLADCRSIFEKYSVEEPLMEITKKQLLKDLLKIEDAPYSGWGWEDGGTSKMSRKLSGYGIEQDRKVGPEDHRERGYLRSDFEDAWKRYLPPLPSKEEEEDDSPSVQPEITVQSVQEPDSEESQSVQPDAKASSRNGSDPHLDALDGKNALDGERPSPFLLREIRLLPMVGLYRDTYGIVADGGEPVPPREWSPEERRAVFEARAERSKVAHAERPFPFLARVRSQS